MGFVSSPLFENTYLNFSSLLSQISDTDELEENELYKNGFYKF